MALGAVAPRQGNAKSDAVACLPAILPVHARRPIILSLLSFFAGHFLRLSFPLTAISSPSNIPALRTASSDPSTPTSVPRHLSARVTRDRSHEENLVHGKS
jgi:hypothetical protein